MQTLKKNRYFTILTAGTFGTVLGMFSMVAPLAAFNAGISLSNIGILAMLAGSAQILLRSTMGRMMRRVTTRFLILASAILIGLSSAALVGSDALAAFVVAQILHGAARALFWTAAQTHAVRTSRTHVGGLAAVNLAAGIGQFLGPVIAGAVLEVTAASTSFGAGAFLAFVTCLLSGGIARLEPFERDARASMWSSYEIANVGNGAWMSVSSGIWKALLDSYVPPLLALALYSDAKIGILVGIGNAAILVGSALTPLAHVSSRWGATIGVAVTFFGVVLTAFGPSGSLVVTGLLTAGAGAGFLQTFGPAIASGAVRHDRQGDAIAISGLFRASALLLTPLGMSGIVAIAPVGAAFFIVGGVVLLPLLTIRSGTARCAD